MVMYNSTFKRNFIRISVFLGLLTFICTTPTQAAVKLTVNKTADTNDGSCTLLDCSLREAITDATSGSTIVFISALSGQTITLGSTLVLDKNLKIDASALSSHIKISGNNNDNVFTVNPSISVSLDHIWIINGDALISGGAIYHNGDLLQINNTTFSSNSAIVSGGAIYNNGELEITNTLFNSNQSSAYGGAIYNTENGTVSIFDCEFNSNHSQEDGGAIYNTGGSVTVTTGSVFSSNYVTATSSGDGGAIGNVDGSLDVSKSIFNSNTSARSGGAIYSSGGSLSIMTSTFSNNTATNGAGGAVFNTTASASISSSTFTGNYANTNGGGIFNGASASIINTTFSGNTSSVRGGGVGNGSSILSVQNCTFTANTAGNSNYGAGLDSESNSLLSLTNNILANSTGGGRDCQNAGTMNDDHNNLIEVNSPVYPCGSPVSSADPLLATIADNGGLTLTFDLLPGSPAIDTGDDATCTSYDQRGVMRPIGLHCDIGSVEKGEALYLPVVYR